MRSSSPPTLVAHVGSIIKGRRESIEVALRRSNDRIALDLRIFAIHGEERTPTSRGVCVPLVDIRSMRRLLAEADAQAVALGLLPAGGAE
ncbi:hypothetical protein D3273_23995 [Lichenibacterium minor]|uniref:Transcriptional coactivator p15 (PC4) C-terminal domain-containing protein n=1 Tax=Lichenibacterium minor TaxID=2316528 RepID=A0A4Q2TZ65_9HYPH|nr:hypothetical protein [Lichenibacterium minor]RYC29413.1 hypothetical protein D3273_23995 [Lichenibacterium minor]